MKPLNSKILTLAVILIFTAQLAFSATPCSEIDCCNNETCNTNKDPYSPTGDNCLNGNYIRI